MPASAVVQNHEERISFLPTERLIAEGPWTQSQQRLLEVLQHEEHRYASIAKICRLAGYSGNTLWYEAMKDERFVAELESLGIPIRKHHLPSHLAVEPAIDLDEELTKDVWDIRRFKDDDPKHVSPATYEVNFSKIDNPVPRLASLPDLSKAACKQTTSTRVGEQSHKLAHHCGSATRQSCLRTSAAET